MKALVCGGRAFTDRARLDRVLDASLDRLGITEIIQGGAPGADSLAKQWAKARGISQREFAADWDHLGKSAGPARNREMLVEGKPDVVLAFIDGSGPGTANMIEQAERAGVRVIKC